MKMYFKNVVRFLNVGSRFYATDKSALATLRKKTGYTFANCKKALELHNNDIMKVNKLEFIKEFYKQIIVK